MTTPNNTNAGGPASMTTDDIIGDLASRMANVGIGERDESKCSIALNFDRTRAIIARMRELRADLAGAQAAIAEHKAAKDGAYAERNQCVAALARAAILLGWNVGTAKTAIEGWDPAWHGCVYIDLPTGQASWHFHDSEAHYFNGLPAYVKPWDGHSTEEKYMRLASLEAECSCGDGPSPGEPLVNGKCINCRLPALQTATTEAKEGDFETSEYTRMAAQRAAIEAKQRDTTEAGRPSDAEVNGIIADIHDRIAHGSADVVRRLLAHVKRLERDLADGEEYEDEAARHRDALKVKLEAAEKRADILTRACIVAELAVVGAGEETIMRRAQEYQAQIARDGEEHDRMTARIAELEAQLAGERRTTWDVLIAGVYHGHDNEKDALEHYNLAGKNRNYLGVQLVETTTIRRTLDPAKREGDDE